MNKFYLIIALLFLATNSIQSQETKEFTTVKTKTGDVKVPGTWTQLNTMDDSGQTYLKNKEEIIIAIAQNPKKAYSFFKANKSDFENVKEFYKWDADYRKENNFKTDKIKENPKQEYVIWKFNDGKLDNMFLFGSSKDSFLNLLIYTNTWTEADKILFLENLYQLNK